MKCHYYHIKYIHTTGPTLQNSFSENYSGMTETPEDKHLPTFLVMFIWKKQFTCQVK